MRHVEILKKLKRLEIKSKRLTTQLFAGQFQAALKGRGLNFKEVREYGSGDDIRFIDWNVSAKMNGLYSKVYEEDKEINIFLLIDLSASNHFGTKQSTKLDLIMELSAVLAFSALTNNDNVGAVFFTDRIEKMIPLKKGKNHLLRILKELITFSPSTSKTNINPALQFLNQQVKSKSVVFILSDFIFSDYQKNLILLSKKHDVIGLHVFDQKEITLPKIGVIQLYDAESDAVQYVDTNSELVQKTMHENHKKNVELTEGVFKKSQASLLSIPTGEDYMKNLQYFFIHRH